ncbi:MAG TPA: HD domain-containing protein [Puia sp.]|nr:HD domain-containing protein [Puia sp.]
METGQQILTEWESRFAGYWLEQQSAGDGSHDLGHFRRVWKAARFIAREEGGSPDLLVLLASAYFHDLVALPKDHPQRRESSRLSAERTEQLLDQRWPDFPRGKIEGVRHAILAHSFSAGVPAKTVEAMILQDADRLEAVGAIGVARTFYTAGMLNAQLFDAGDPLAKEREPNDRQYALDHFQVKLFRLPAMMNTATARRLAEKNADWMRGFVEKLCSEIAGEFGARAPA